MNHSSEIMKVITGPLSVNTWFIPLEHNTIVIVDPGGDASTIIAHLQKASLEPVAFLLTHGHFDHISGLSALHEVYTELPIVIHESESHWLGEGALAQHRNFFRQLGAAEIVDRYGSELPAATSFLTEGPLLIAGIESSVLSSWRVLHTPGHSPGSVCLYNEHAQILVAGDTLFSGGVGRTDGPGGSFEALSTSLARLFTLPPETRVLTGHGGTTTIGREING